MGNTQDLLDRLKAENRRLNDEKQQLKAELESTQRDLNDCQQSRITSNPKIASLEQKRNQPTTNEISDELKAQFSEVGIRLNQTLRELIKSVPEEQVRLLISRNFEMLNRSEFLVHRFESYALEGNLVLY